MTAIGRAVRVLTATLPLLCACSSSCPREEANARRHSNGITNASATHYETNAWNGAFLDFPAGRRYALVHGLRAAPIELRSYLGFEERPLPDGENGFAAESAGNQVLIEGVDEEVVRVRNDSCEHFYLRLVASTIPEAESTGGSAGSGASGVGGAP